MKEDIWQKISTQFYLDLGDNNNFGDGNLPPPSTALWNSNVSNPRRLCAFRAHNQVQENADKSIGNSWFGNCKTVPRPFKKPVADLRSPYSCHTHHAARIPILQLSCESGLENWEREDDAMSDGMMMFDVGWDLLGQEPQKNDKSACQCVTKARQGSLGPQWRVATFTG